MQYSRCDIINYYIKSRNYTKYLEIGVEYGHLINNVICENKIGVDPKPKCSKDILDNYIVKTTSDEFFTMIDNNDKFDIIFIDGDHHYSQVAKDIHNALNHLTDNGIILLHDMYCEKESYMNFDNYAEGKPYTGDGFIALIQMIMLNELDHKYNVYFTCIDGVAAIDTQNTIEIYKQDNILDRYIDLIESHISNFTTEKIDRNNKEQLRIIISSFIITFNDYNKNIKWLYPICNIQQLNLEKSNVQPVIKNNYFY